MDWEDCLRRCDGKAPLIAEVVKQGGSWIKLSDVALELDTRNTEGRQALSRMLAQHQQGSKPRLLCEESNLNLKPIDHLLRVHLHDLGLNRENFDVVEQVLSQLVGGDIKFVYKFRKLLLDPFWSVVCIVLCNCFLIVLGPSLLYIIVPYVGLYRWTLNLCQWKWHPKLEAIVFEWVVKSASRDFEVVKKWWGCALLRAKCCCFVCKPAWEVHAVLS